jgi:hypothetical protein
MKNMCQSVQVYVYIIFSILLLLHYLQNMLLLKIYINYMLSFRWTLHTLLVIIILLATNSNAQSHVGTSIAIKT